MGYRRKGTVFKLIFEDPEMEGLIVKARNPSMGDMFEVMNFRNLSGINRKNISSEDMIRIREMFEFFGKFIVEWNLEDEQGNPVPCDVQGLLSQDLAFVFPIITTWLGALQGIDNPLKEKSNGGLPLEVGEIPTETLLGNLVSSPEPN